MHMNIHIITHVNENGNMNICIHIHNHVNANIKIITNIRRPSGEEGARRPEYVVIQSNDSSTFNDKNDERASARRVSRGRAGSRSRVAQPRF